VDAGTISLWLFFFGTAALVLTSIEVGFRLGRSAHRRSKEEMESPAAAMAGAILGLVAFMLAFTFGIASSRFDTRKELVRNEANAIETTWLRADFIPQPDREEVRRLIVRYLDERLMLVRSPSAANIEAALRDIEELRQRLWQLAVEHGQRDLDSDVAALYVDSLNEMFNLHHQRVAVGIQVRIPLGVWLALYALSALGMLGMGYQAGITGSKRSGASLILALSFALVTSMIAALDGAGTSGFRVPQQPLIDVRSRIAPNDGGVLHGEGP
jgi:hypothetical protein